MRSKRKKGNSKGFKDLVFKRQSYGIGLQACIELDNGYIVSVISNNKKDKSGKYDFYYGNINEGTYEVAILDKDNNFMRLREGNDVLAYQSEAQIDNLIKFAETGKDFKDFCRKNEEPADFSPSLSNNQIDVSDDILF